MEIEVIEAESYYHIYNRGINKEIIFYDDEYYRKFLTLYKKYIPLIADTLAYCLLPNHFHFLVYIHSDYPDGVSKPRRGNNPFGNLFNAYAQWFNKKQNRTGGLFQRPFRRKKITDEDYLKQVIYYIHRNPQHHNINKNLENYIYSSFRSIISEKPTLLQRDKVISWFDDKENFFEYHKQQFKIDLQLFFDDN